MLARGLARSPHAGALAPSLMWRWMRQPQPVVDPAAGFGPIGRLMLARGRPITPLQERLVLVALLVAALLVCFLAGFVVGGGFAGGGPAGGPVG